MSNPNSKIVRSSRSNQNYLFFDLDGESFSSGSTIHGVAALVVQDEQIRTAGIYIKWEGREYACWQKSSTEEFSAERIIFSKTQPLWSPKDEDEKDLTRGTYSWPFSWQLPSDIPSSYVDITEETVNIKSILPVLQGLANASSSSSASSSSMSTVPQSSPNNSSTNASVSSAIPSAFSSSAYGSLASSLYSSRSNITFTATLIVDVIGDPQSPPSTTQSNLTQSQLSSNINNNNNTNNNNNRIMRATRPFRVVQRLDPEVIKLDPITKQQEKNYLFTKQPVTFKVTLPNGGVAFRGHHLPLRVEILNGPRKKLDTITMTMHQTLVYNAKGEMQQKKTVAFIGSAPVLDTTPAENPISVTKELLLNIPADTDPSITLGTLVQRHYELTVELSVSMGSNAIVSFQVQIFEPTETDAAILMKFPYEVDHLRSSNNGTSLSTTAANAVGSESDPNTTTTNQAPPAKAEDEFNAPEEVIKKKKEREQKILTLLQQGTSPPPSPLTSLSPNPQRKGSNGKGTSAGGGHHRKSHSVSGMASFTTSSAPNSPGGNRPQRRSSNKDKAGELQSGEQQHSPLVRSREDLPSVAGRMSRQNSVSEPYHHGSHHHHHNSSVVNKPQISITHAADDSELQRNSSAPSVPSRIASYDIFEERERANPRDSWEALEL